MLDRVIWPHQFDPKISAIYALNDIDVNAPPEVVWKLLVDAENWSSYFPPEDQVKILTGEPETGARNQIQPGDGRLSNAPCGDGVRVRPKARVVDVGRRRGDRFERLPRLGHRTHGQWLPCAIRGDTARPLFPRGARSQGPCQTKSGPMHHYGMASARQDFRVRIRP
jgi:hypothetical protein